MKNERNNVLQQKALLWSFLIIIEYNNRGKGDIKIRVTIIPFIIAKAKRLTLRHHFLDSVELSSNFTQSNFQSLKLKCFLQAFGIMENKVK